MKPAKTLILLICLLITFLVIWSPLHELMHLITAKLFGGNAKLEWSLLKPYINFSHRADLPITIVFITAIAPYLLDFIVIILSFFNNQFFKVAGFLGFFDVSGNLLLSPFYGGDYITILESSIFLGFAMIMFMISCCIIWIKNNRGYKQQFTEFWQALKKRYAHKRH